MLKSIVFRNTTIRFEDIGQGEPIVLLHGFLESLDVWDEFAEELARDFRVISIDLPGHGRTGIVDFVHTMDIMAEAVKEVLDYLGLHKILLVGHSMGGYVSLQFLKDYPDYLCGLILLHSSPLPDTEERKKARDEMIRGIKSGKKVVIAKEHVNKTFAPDNIEKFVKKVGFLKIIALNTPNDGIVAALEGMKRRPDYRQVLKKATIPVLYVLGLKDNFIPVDILGKFELPKSGEVLKLESSGHQGFIEEKEKVLEEIRNFAKKCFK